eukprot:TRINITY_DN94126_c0_g1_i1.p1 TRINITY_DN94126_c0_g1~~TRINITY_DN94126_c0_g1_i1.p1  ORF type:complete len:437 (+),score=61.71 TRINITY_DN94126_c0_g1_i1:141-1451(+)
MTMRTLASAFVNVKPLALRQSYRHLLRRHLSTGVASQRVQFPREVLIAGAARTPIGSFCGSLAPLPAARLGAAAASAALRRAGIEPDEVEMVFFGQALPAGCGQNTARHAALLAEIPPSVDSTGINKACASGLKAVSLAAQAIAMGQVDIAVVGGMENMSQAPYMVRHARQGGYRYGHGTLEDSALHDGLWDPHMHCHIGACAEITAQEMGITREEQDQYAVTSYRRAADAWQRGAMDTEVVPVRVKPSDTSGGKSTVVSIDEEYSRLRLETLASLPPVFQEGGTITAANASSLNDGAAALVLISAEKAMDLGVGGLARILSFADHGVVPANFALAPHGAVSRALRAARMSAVDFHEIHEAFSVIPLANMRLLGLDSSRVNVNGGGVSLGHPLGASGSRILCTLLSVLAQQDAETGCASIANGGGGATAVVVERMR